MNFARIFQHALARRLAAFIVAAILAWFGMGQAHAQDTSLCFTSNDTAYCQTRPDAYNAGLAEANLRHAPEVGYTGPGPDCVQGANANGPQKYYRCSYRTVFGTSSVFRYWLDGCPADKPWNESTKSCGSPCADAPNLGPSAITGSLSASMCSNGCAYRQKVDPNGDFSSLCLGSGASKFCAAKGWEPTGETCQADQFPSPEPFDPNKPVCSTNSGGYTECVKPNGQHCITSAAGRSLCYNLGDTGPRTTADGKLGADRVAAPLLPVAPPKLLDPVPVSSSSTTINNTTYNTTTYEGSGSAPGQSNPGDGGNDDGPGGDQEGETNGLLGQIKASIDKIGGWLDGIGNEAGGLDTSPGDDVDPDTAWIEEDETPDLNAGGYGWGRSCPAPPQISVPGGGQVDFTLLCTAAGLFGALILAAAYVQAAFIIGRA